MLLLKNTQNKIFNNAFRTAQEIVTYKTWNHISDEVSSRVLLQVWDMIWNESKVSNEHT